MGKTELYIGYLIWAILILFVSFVFDFLSTKSEKFSKLFLGTFFSSWFFLAIAFIVRDIVLNKFYFGINLKIFSGYLAQSLPTLVIGLIAFTFKYSKFKKRNNPN